MEPSLRTPLLDLFRRDEVARDVRLLAARGAVAPRGLEQLVLLMLLTGDRDDEIRGTAENTLSRLPADRVSAFLARSEVPADLRDFFAQRGVPAGGTPLAEEPDSFVDQDDTDYGPDGTSEKEKESLLGKIAAMSVPEKVKAAMKGTREMRAILVRDPNKLVALSVL